MILTYLTRAIIARVKADTGTGGLYSASGGTAWNTSLIPGGIWAVRGNPDDATMPFGVLTITGEKSLSMSSDGMKFRFTFDIVGAESTDPSVLSSVVDRLHGNAVLANPPVPTYGFMRHKLILATNDYTAICSECIVESTSLGVSDVHANMASVTYSVECFTREAS